jgi:CRP/FNR family transcriptional regulator, cyclic AMP receptor protein
VFGELSALLDQPHSADVRALEASEFHVADAAALLGQDPAALLYVTMMLARRLDGANQMFLELKNQLATGEPPGLIDATLDKIEDCSAPSAPATSAPAPGIRAIRLRRRIAFVAVGRISAA